MMPWEGHDHSQLDNISAKWAEPGSNQSNPDRETFHGTTDLASSKPSMLQKQSTAEGRFHIKEN